MPGFDGTGPRGEGPFSGGGRGYCAIPLPRSETGVATLGYAGLQGSPVRLAVRRQMALGRRWARPMAYGRRTFGRGRRWSGRARWIRR